MSINAYPRYELQGAEDKSTVVVPTQTLELGTHVPLFVIQSEKGTTEKTTVHNLPLNALYGDETFNFTSKYYTPATKFLQDLYGMGSPVVVKRHVDPNVKTVANVAIYVDVLNDKVDVYKRHNDGSIAYDSNGNPIVDQSDVDGIKVKIIAEINNVEPDSPMGTLTVKNGTMKDSNGNSSTMYPILEFRATNLGEYYNRVGFSIAPVTGDDVDVNIIDTLRNLQYKLSIYTKDINGNPVVVKDLYGATSEKFVLQPYAKDPVLNTDIDINAVLDYWYNETNPDLPYRVRDLNDVYVYTDNIATVASKMINADANYIDADVTTVEGDTVNTSEWLDVTKAIPFENQYYLVNLFNCFSSKRVPYFTVQISDDAASLAENQQEVVFAENLPIFLGGGIDGNVSWSELQNGVSTLLDEYVDPVSKVQDILINPENVMYDVGYDLDIKRKMVNFITLRKDTIIVLGTRQYSDGQKVNTLVEDRAVAVALRSACDLAPESTFYGTPVTRAIIVLGAGRINGWVNKDYYPLTYDLAIKNAKLMSGKVWDVDGAMFDRGERNVINTMYDIKPDFIPVPTRSDIWDIGVIYPQPYDDRRMFFAGLQSVYSRDNSVLGNYFLAFALTYINKVAVEIWRDLTGDITLTPGELQTETENRANAKLKNAFGGIIKVVPKAYFTKDDVNAGYIWRLDFKVGANIAKTVMYTHPVVFRMEDL